MIFPILCRRLPVLTYGAEYFPRTLVNGLTAAAITFGEEPRGAARQSKRSARS
jgi:hypothetical protein